MSLNPHTTTRTVRPPSAAPMRGRGAHTNASGRYERFARALEDDGWGSAPPETRLPTREIKDAARTIITRNQSPDLSFDRSINPYRGCEHGCSYCYARPSHAYLGLSPGLDFETQLYFKPEAAKLLERELRAPGYVPRSMAMGTNTDPYQPIERTRRITRSILEVLAAFRHPVAIVTKSALVTRDIDILGPMAEDGLAKVALSVTTLDAGLARAMEPRASTPAKRLEAISLLTRAGIPTAVMTAPMIPGLTDMELEAILERAAAAGARQAGYVVLRMPYEIKDLFREWLAAHVPDRAERVIKLMREMRGGKDYDAQWSQRQVGRGPYADLIAKRFRLAVKRYGLSMQRLGLRTDLFEVPPAPGDQLALL